MSDTEKLEKSREIGRDMADAYWAEDYGQTPTRNDIINRVRAKHDSLSYAEAELMWMAIDAYVESHG